MKKLIVYYLPYKDFNIDIFLDELISTKKNNSIKIKKSTFTKKNGYLINFSFINRNNKIELCLLEMKEIDLVKFFNESIDDLIKISYKLLSNWKNSLDCKEGFDNSDESKEKIKNQIGRVFNKYHSHLEDSNDFYKKNLLGLISELMFYILMGHHLSNGNKRLSLLLSINLLYFFGYYLKFTRGSYKNYQYYESTLENFVCEFSNVATANISDIDKISKIYEWLNKSVIIAINFKKK